MKTRSDLAKNLSRILQKVCEIAEKSANGDYIFRGESRFYDGEVSSSLYREYQYDIEMEDFDIEFVQENILGEAKKYVHKQQMNLKS